MSEKKIIHCTHCGYVGNEAVNTLINCDVTVKVHVHGTMNSCRWTYGRVNIDSGDDDAYYCINCGCVLTDDSLVDYIKSNPATKEK